MGVPFASTISSHPPIKVACRDRAVYANSGSANDAPHGTYLSVVLPVEDDVRCMEDGGCKEKGGKEKKRKELQVRKAC